jgi:hypothetical protein
MLMPTLKPGQYLTLQPDGKIWVGARLYGHGTELEDESGLVWPLCGLLDGTARDIDRHSRTLEFFTNIDTSSRGRPELVTAAQTAAKRSAHPRRRLPGPVRSHAPRPRPGTREGMTLPARPGLERESDGAGWPGSPRPAPPRWYPPGYRFHVRARPGRKARLADQMSGDLVDRVRDRLAEAGAGELREEVCTPHAAARTSAIAAASPCGVCARQRHVACSYPGDLGNDQPVLRGVADDGDLPSRQDVRFPMPWCRAAVHGSGRKAIRGAACGPFRRRAAAP